MFLWVDGQRLEVWDYAVDFSWILIDGGRQVTADGETLVEVEQGAR